VSGGAKRRGAEERLPPFEFTGRARARIVQSHADEILQAAQFGSRAFWVTIVVVILVMGSVELPILCRSYRSPIVKQHLQRSILQQVALACRLYAEDHQGRFPDRLSDLVPKYLPHDEYLFYADAETHERKPWCYRPGLTNTSPPDLFLAWSPDSTSSGRRVGVHCDASAQILREEDFRAEMKRQIRGR
jgi:hypothetical protein